MPGPRVVPRLGKRGGPSTVKNLFNIDFETGDLSQFSATTDPDADLSAGAAGAMNGTANGMSVIVDDVNACYGTIQFAAVTEQIRIRVFIDPNGLTMGAGDAFNAFRFQGQANPWTLANFQLAPAGANYELVFSYNHDGGWNIAVAYGITDAPHYVECFIQRASSAVAGDGNCYWYVDGVLARSRLNYDNYDVFGSLTTIYMGVFDGMDVTTFGTFYLDECAGNTTGEEIGTA